MAPLRALPLIAVTAILGACAHARTEPGGDDQQAQPDAATPRPDAPRQSTADAPSTGCASAFTGVLATWDFATQPGNQASTPVKTAAPGLVAGPIERASTLTPVSALNAINSSNWPIT